ncbi:MAG TPA: FtsX-like permease family protein [Chloroflexota bacterium]|nr:FtsX-like permease family protein [Chloroflexota bacterium]
MATPRQGTVYRASWSAGLPYPVRNVWRRRRGLLGMILGVGIALGLGMTMLAVSQASIDLFTGDYKVSSADLYVTTEGGKPVPILAGETPGTIDDARHVMAQLRGLPGVTAVLGTMSWTLERERPGPKVRDAPKELLTVMGVEGDPNDIPGALRLDEGRWPRRNDEIMLGTKLSRDKGLPLGSTVRLAGRDFQVVGIGRLRGFGFSGDSLGYIQRESLRQRASLADIVNMIAVASKDPPATRQRIDDLESLSVFSADDLIRLAEEANQAGVVIRFIMVLLTLVIAALFVANMLSRSVAERRLELATLKAIGVPGGTIIWSIAGEALLVCVAAYFVGIGMALFFGYLINELVAKSFGFESLFAVDAGSFVLVFVVAVGLGLLAGLFPARQATRVDPVEVLREA